MKRVVFILFVLFLLPGALRAQAVGQVRFGSRVFSTGFPAHIPEEYFENDVPKMPKERREIALRCVERTFGKVKEYEEYWGDCIGSHMLKVILESGDELWFADGCLDGYTIVSSRFTVAADKLRGGLKVGQKLDLKKSRGEWIIRQRERDPKVYYYQPQWSDDAASFEVDDQGIIVSISMFTNDC